MIQVFYLDIAYVYYNCFKCSSSIFASVLDAYFKCFICFQTYVAIVASECFKTRPSVASPSSPFCCLASVSGVERLRQSPLAWVAPRACRWAQQARRGQAGAGYGMRGTTAQASGRRLASKHPDVPLRLIIILLLQV
jgi:hypothetical protein